MPRNRNFDELERQEPLDSDSDDRDRSALPGAGGVDSGLARVLVVLAGGFAGTVVRVLLSNAVGNIRGFPVGIFVVNLIGAALLGLLLESLARRGPDLGWRRLARLGLGTGVLGGFTTYSALAVGAVALGEGRQLLGSVAYCLLTVAGGVVAAGLGVRLGQILPGPARAPGEPPGTPPSAEGKRR